MIDMDIAKIFGGLCTVAIVTVIGCTVATVEQPPVKSRNCTDCAHIPSSELWKHLEPVIKDDPYRGCQKVMQEKTGKRRSTGVGTIIRYEYETIRRWNCLGDIKYEVLYLEW